MASYRLIDELPSAQKKQAVYSPFGLFFLTWLFLPSALPFWIINWGRLGRPEHRIPTAVGGVAAFGLPLLLAHWGLGQTNVELAQTLLKFLFAYVLLHGQRPLHVLHLNRGGEKAAVWPVWLAAVVGVLFLILVPPLS